MQSAPVRVFSLGNVFISKSESTVRSISTVISEKVNARSIGYRVFGYFSSLAASVSGIIPGTGKPLRR